MSSSWDCARFTTGRSARSVTGAAGTTGSRGVIAEISLTDIGFLPGGFELVLGVVEAAQAAPRPHEKKLAEQVLDHPFRRLVVRDGQLADHLAEGVVDFDVHCRSLHSQSE